MISAIVLAAGLSTRMGEQNKLLLELDGQPIIRIVASRLIGAEPGEVIVVLGHDSERIKAALAGLNLIFIRNEKFTEGMTTSIQAGISLATGDGYMICLSDMYAIEISEYKFMATFFAKERALDPRCICIPVFEESRGNPVIFSKHYREKILKHDEPEGCRKIVTDNKAHLRKLAMTNAHILQDLDYPEDYTHIQKR
ncbi:MAG: nucleotidyltransferase family protein [Chitinophagaceae bacterium]